MTEPFNAIELGRTDHAVWFGTDAGEVYVIEPNDVAEWTRETGRDEAGLIVVMVKAPADGSVVRLNLPAMAGETVPARAWWSAALVDEETVRDVLITAGYAAGHRTWIAAEPKETTVRDPRRVQSMRSGLVISR